MTDSRDNWHSCRGEVHELVTQLNVRATSQRRKSHILAFVSALTLIVLAVTLHRVGPSTIASPVPISCASVREQTAQIISGSLDSETQLRVDAHLAYCRPCEAHIEEARAAVADSPRLSFIALASR